MEFSYTLTPEDLAAGLRTVHLERVQRLRRSRASLVLTVVFTGLLVWPLTAFVFEPWVGRLGAILAHLAVIGVAVPIGLVVRARLESRLVFPGLAEWSVRRQLSRALPKSVLGPIVLRVSESGLWRKNERDELTVPPGEVLRAMWSTECAVVHLRSRRVLVVPARAFDGPAHAARFRDAVSRATGRPFVEVLLAPS